MKWTHRNLKKKKENSIKKKLLIPNFVMKLLNFRKEHDDKIKKNFVFHFLHEMSLYLYKIFKVKSLIKFQNSENPKFLWNGKIFGKACR